MKDGLALGTSWTGVKAPFVGLSRNTESPTGLLLPPPGGFLV